MLIMLILCRTLLLTENPNKPYTVNVSLHRLSLEGIICT